MGRWMFKLRNYVIGSFKVFLMHKIDLVFLNALLEIGNINNNRDVYSIFDVINMDHFVVASHVLGSVMAQ